MLKEDEDCGKDGRGRERILRLRRMQSQPGTLNNVFFDHFAFKQQSGKNMEASMFTLY